MSRITYYLFGIVALSCVAIGLINMLVYNLPTRTEDAAKTGFAFFIVFFIGCLMSIVFVVTKPQSK